MTSLRVRLLASRLHASLGLLQGPALYTVQADVVSIRGGRVADKESLTSYRACSTARLLPRPSNRTSQCTTEAPKTPSCASGRPEAAVWYVSLKDMSKTQVTGGKAAARTTMKTYLLGEEVTGRFVVMGTVAVGGVPPTAGQRTSSARSSLQCS